MIMIMKKLSILFLVSFVFFIHTSCNEWLDVRSKEEILQEDAFKQGGGYRSALVGIYRLLADQKLWGKELTWGLLVLPEEITAYQALAIQPRIEL
jgi:hypothetical protein